MATGTVVTIKLEKGFGFIREHGARDVFFHANDLSPSLPFDELLREREVTFDVMQTPKGLRAVNIKPAR